VYIAGLSPPSFLKNYIILQLAQLIAFICNTYRNKIRLSKLLKDTKCIFKLLLKRSYYTTRVYKAYLGSKNYHISATMHGGRLSSLKLAYALYNLRLSLYAAAIDHAKQGALRIDI
jgi:hypothetical protein